LEYWEVWPQGYVSLECEQLRVRQEIPQVVEETRSSPPDNRTHVKTQAQVWIPVEHIVADVFNEKEYDFVFDTFVAGKNVFHDLPV
jgi:hypothetical protein